MKYYSLIIILFFVSACSVSPVSDGRVSGDVKAYGIYRYPEKSSSVWSNSESTNSTIIEHDVPPKLVKRTSEIPLEKGIYFAFSYEISGLPEGVVTLNWAVKHPEIVKPDGSTSTGYSYQRVVHVKNGIASGISGYSLDEDYEMVDGKWTFTYEYKGKPVVTKTFIVLSE